MRVHFGSGILLLVLSLFISGCGELVAPVASGSQVDLTPPQNLRGMAVMALPAFAESWDYFDSTRTAFLTLDIQETSSTKFSLTINVRGDGNFFVYKTGYYQKPGGTWQEFTFPTTNGTEPWRENWIKNRVQATITGLASADYTSEGAVVVYVCKEQDWQVLQTNTVVAGLDEASRQQLQDSFGGKRYRYFCGLAQVSGSGLVEQKWSLREFTGPTVCTSTCTGSSFICSNGVLKRCQEVLSGCRQYVMVENCTAGGKQCDEAVGCFTQATCTDGDSDGYNLSSASCGTPDCNDADSAIHPGAAEVCNGKDDDCDGQVDEGFGLGGTCTVGIGACMRTGVYVCNASGTGVKCNASSGTPTAERCDGVDNDCNGVLDDGCDGDNDEYCNASMTRVIQYSCSGSTNCCPSGGNDCNDADSAIHPGAVEVCNGKDDDCDGQVDEEICGPSDSELFQKFLEDNRFTSANVTQTWVENRLKGLIVKSRISSWSTLPQFSALEDLQLNDGSNAAMPNTIGNLKELRNLTVHRKLPGVVPDSIYNLTNLETLYFSFPNAWFPNEQAETTWSLSSRIGELKNLKTIIVYGVDVQGVLPPEICQLSQLSSIQFINTPRLRGQLPSCIGQLPLSEIQFFRCNLTGTIPSSLGQITSLREIWLNNNQLTGSIPPTFGQLTQLMYLNLAHNQLTGSLPAELGNLSALQQLYLSNNTLSGPVPESMLHYPALGFVSVQGNCLTDADVLCSTYSINPLFCEQRQC